MITDLEKQLAGIVPFRGDISSYLHDRKTCAVNWYDLSLNFNSTPHKSDVAILVTTWMGHLRWLKYTLTNYRLTGKFVICAYDLPLYGWSVGTAQRDVHLPRIDHYLLAHSWLHKHVTYDADKRNGWFWSVRYAQGIIKQFSNFKYVFCVNGDCLWEKPDGIAEILTLLGDADLMANSTESKPGSPGNIHTASVIYKIDAFNAVVDFMAEIMRVPILGAQSPEGMLRLAVSRLNLNEQIAPQQPIYPADGSIDHYTCYGEPSTWREILGYRNLYAEQETACIERLEPLPKEYIDDYQDYLYLPSYERATVCNYYKTGDRRYIYQWWDQSETSWYDRLYYPIESYGPTPIYDKEV